MTAAAQGPELTLPPWLTRLAEACGEVGASDLSRFVPPADGDARQSAVLILFGEGRDGPDVLLIRRSAAMRDHAGQVAFPGGGAEPHDDGPVATALREAAEETGLDPQGVQVIAVLPTLWVPRSNFAVTPVVGWWRDPVAVHAQDAIEIAAVARVPLGTLTDPTHRGSVGLSGGILGPAFALPDLFVWGFTAGLLARLLDLGGWSVPWDAARLLDLPDSVAGGWRPRAR